jgi:hypothetical protein
VTPGLWRLERFLAPRDCAVLTVRAEAAGLRPAHLHAEGRRNREAFLHWPDVRAILARRLRRRMRDCPGLDLRTARFAGPLECYRYDPGDHVAAHRDASAPGRPDAGTECTLLIYLTDGVVGGATVFPELGVSVRPARGDALLFRSSLLHEGALVQVGTKYVLRCSVTGVSLMPPRRKRPPMRREQPRARSAGGVGPARPGSR